MTYFDLMVICTFALTPSKSVKPFHLWYKFVSEFYFNDQVVQYSAMAHHPGKDAEEKVMKQRCIDYTSNLWNTSVLYFEEDKHATSLV